MKTAIDSFWEACCKENDLTNESYTDAFPFGASADWLAQLVAEGKKTATTSGYVFYELEDEPLPEKGQYYIVLNSRDEPVAVIQIENVEVRPMNEVTEEFALREGEGDYKDWREAHETFFTEELAKYQLTFTPDMPVVCETFKVVCRA